MPVEVVTIVNSSGKIISNGRHIINILKEAKASYQEKKASIKAERAVRRSDTFDIPTVPRYYDGVEYGRRASHDDAASQATSRRSYRSKYSGASKHRSASQTRPALTERNLKTLTEVSSTAPSRPPVAYQSPYAETAPRDMALSRPTLAQAPIYVDEPPMHNMPVPRSISDPALGDKKKDIDEDLAYGNVPPDLAERVDLDPAYKAEQKERKAMNLMEKIEQLLTETQCLHHTATHIIQHLQGNPDAAAAVALTLAELSALLGKMSPSFLAVIKGGSPAIFALLASPQFLIAAGVTVGVTVVMFGGWKIVKRIQEVKEAEANAVAPMAFAAHQPELGDAVRAPYPESEISAGFDEALVIEEELSGIENWRRGIVPFGEDAQADLELISPEADRAIRGQYGGDDARSVRTSKTHRTTKTNKTSKTTKTSKSHKSHKPTPENESNGGHKETDNASEAGSHRSHRSHRSTRSDRTERTSKTKRSEKVELKAIEDGRSDRENSINVVLRPKKDNMLKALFKKKKDREVYSVVR
ncbi:uncharacterized protein F4822DRAFT_274311 [Hypoxylon trugodes]|uniref:uncharacterized protein n=1 Tax=Hypoxylon trugodes TaxID=326681 RepID=UPI0021945656|nr:uncharacterized protein F4822DRAFT_274311 [Hypoxylon trugodes]KAI1387113.1 hypothetical protein F4822DRAFT_274311 [Hypoxylon trugodes]